VSPAGSNVPLVANLSPKSRAQMTAGGGDSDDKKGKR